MKKLISILSLMLCVSLCHAQTTWDISNTSESPGERVVATLEATSIGSYTGITLTGTVTDYSGNWGYASPVVANFSLYIRYTATSTYELIQSRKTKNAILRLRQVSSSVYNLTANCAANERLSINYSVQFGSTVTVTPGDEATLNNTGTLVIAEPTYLSPLSDKGISLNTSTNMNGGLSVTSYTGGRNTTTGAQLEFIIPANSDGTNMYGQGRIITVAGNTSSSNATGKMILGTRRSFDKLGTGTSAWYYGDDITIDGSGNVGIGNTAPTEPLSIASGNGYTMSLLRNTTGGNLAVSKTGGGIYFGSFDPAASVKYPGASIRAISTEAWTAGSAHGSALVFETATNTTTSIVERMRVDNNGNVGIGITGPKVILSLSKKSDAANPIGSSDNPAIFIKNANSANYNEKAEVQFAIGNTNYASAAISALYTHFYGVADVGADLIFSTKGVSGDGTAISEKMRLTAAGGLLIGKTSSNAGTNYMLDVNGNVRANKLVVNTTGADFVFEPNYALPSLQSVEAFIKKYHHLPGIASANEMQSKGLDVGEHQTNLLQKTEELMLYVIEQDKRLEMLDKTNIGQQLLINDQASKLDEQKKQIFLLKQRLDEQEELLKMIKDLVKSVRQKDSLSN